MDENAKLNLGNTVLALQDRVADQHTNYTIAWFALVGFAFFFVLATMFAAYKKSSNWAFYFALGSAAVLGLDKALGVEQSRIFYRHAEAEVRILALRVAAVQTQEALISARSEFDALLRHVAEKAPVGEGYRAAAQLRSAVR